MNVVSVICKTPDARLHLAPYEPGLGTSVFTLCLQRWKWKEHARQDSILCAECVAKWAAKQLKEEHSSETH